MTFKTWCLENPTKTGGYRALESRLKSLQEEMDNYKQQLEEALRGEYVRDESEFFKMATVNSDYLTRAFLKLPFSPFGASESDENIPGVVPLKEEMAALLQKQTSLEKSIKEAEKRHWDTQLRIKSRRERIVVCKKRIKQIKQLMKGYKVDEYTFEEWRYTKDKDPEIEFVDAINNRIGCFGGWDSIDDQPFDTDYAIHLLEEIINRVYPDSVFSLNFKPRSWMLEWDNNGVHIEAQSWDGIDFGLQQMLLEMLDADWERLIPHFLDIDF